MNTEETKQQSTLQDLTENSDTINILENNSNEEQLKRIEEEQIAFEAQEKLEKEEKQQKEKNKTEEKEEKIKELEIEEKQQKNNSSENNDNEQDNDFDWNTVNKLVGLDVNYKELEIEPTPQGAAKYVNKVIDLKFEEFEDKLEKNYPREYQALQLAIEGKDSSVLYKKQEKIDYSKIDIKNTDTNTIKEILNDYYLSKGLSKDKVFSLIKMAEDDEKLTDDFKIAINELKTKAEDENKLLIEQASKERAKEKELINNLSSFLQEKIIKKGEIGNFTIPVKDRELLYNKFAEQFQYSDGKFYIIKEYNKDEIDKEIQSEFFKLKQGNLEEFIKIKADTASTKRLRNNIDKDKNNNSVSSSGNKSKNLTLKDLEE